MDKAERVAQLREKEDVNYTPGEVLEMMWVLLTWRYSTQCFYPERFMKRSITKRFTFTVIVPFPRCVSL
jgi:hypothetical protein